MKKALALILAVLMLVSLVACAGQNAAQSETATTDIIMHSRRTSAVILVFLMSKSFPAGCPPAFVQHNYITHTGAVSMCTITNLRMKYRAD